MKCVKQTIPRVNAYVDVDDAFDVDEWECVQMKSDKYCHK